MSFSKSSLRVQSQSDSALNRIVHFIGWSVIAIAVVFGGLWLLGTIIGLTFGLFALVLTAAPVLIFIWLAWLLIKAIFI